ncbi:MAG TPA: polysaccharide biosynthesis C-terminal domain-containing protein [Methanocorpusculum sp.]|nr:polysaccharide biosynthesis C-terminal domain-containing protein [Methanocorpusculum sp.]
MTLNAVLLWYYLRQHLAVRCDLRSAGHILLSALLMAAVILVYMQFVLLTNIFLVLVPVAIGAVLYFVVLFRLNREIHDEIADLSKQFGLPWPRWL